MNYSQTLEFLFSSMPTFQEKGVTAYKPGLERIAAFCRHLGNPQRNYFTIHVAGTNGKGSVSHIIAAVLQQAGYRTGLFTSPHLHDFRERIRVDGEMIPKQKVVNFVDKHRDKMTELGLSFFEMTAALAFDYFAQSDVEVAVIETGLGGRLDATNILLPIVSVVTNVGLEHTALLGDTLAKIAAEKAGIIKKSIPFVLGEANAAYDAVFEQVAAANKTRVVYAEREFACEGHELCGDRQHFRMVRRRDGHVLDFDLDLLGEYQCRNVLTALATLDLLHEQTPLTISRRAFVDGAASAARTTALQGRWQSLGERPKVLCDTGHNAHGLAYVAEQLRARTKAAVSTASWLFGRQGHRRHSGAVAARRLLSLYAGGQRTGASGVGTGRPRCGGGSRRRSGRNGSRGRDQGEGARRSRRHDLHRRFDLRRGRGVVTRFRTAAGGNERRGARN